MVDEVLIGVLIATIVNGLFDAIVVAALAGRRSKRALIDWLESDDAEPYYDAIGAKAESRILPKVDERLGHLEARFSAELPHPDVQIADMKAELDTAIEEIRGKVDGIDQGMGKAFELLDSKLQSAFALEGQAERQLREKLGEAAQDMEGAMQGAIQELDPQNPIAQRMYAMLTRPVDAKWESKYPGQAFLLQAGKTWIAQNVLPGLMAGGDTQRAARAFLGSGNAGGEAVH